MDFEEKVNKYFKIVLILWGVLNLIFAVKALFTDWGFEGFWSLEYKYVASIIFSFALARVIDLFEVES